MEKLSKKGFKDAIEKARKGNQDEILYVFHVLGPFIDRMIRKLGVRPDSRQVHGMGYFELLAEADVILFSQILPNYDSKKGDFLRYSKRFLSKEIAKRLYRCRRRLKREIPFTNIGQHPSRDRCDHSPCAENEILETFRSFQVKDLQFRRVEVLISLGETLKGLSPLERRFLRNLLKGEESYRAAGRKKISRTTLWRRRKDLARKILPFL